MPSQPSSPGLRGSLDPRQPHTINNLIIQHLGNDEVIATVRDDGDVAAVLVRHVQQAIDRRAEVGNTIGVIADEVKPIFQSNVGISAWGLAIHTQARILATSSNAHEVRVFKFGLLHEHESTIDEGSEVAPHDDGESITAAGDKPDVERRMDVTQRVLNGDANIPYIAFCNTGDDPEARWLLTTDISGYCRVMDLRSTQDDSVAVQQFRFGRSFPGRGGDFDRLNAGWTVMFLDTRSFQPEKRFRDAVGLDENGSLPRSRDNGTCWDLSDTVDLLPDNSPAFTYNDPKRHQPGTRSPITSSALEPEAPSSSDGRESEVEMDTETSLDASEVTAEEGAGDQTMDELDDNMHEPSPLEDEADAFVDDDDVLNDNLVLIDDEDLEDEGTEDSISFNAIYGGKRIFGNQPYFYHQGGLCEDLPCPILHASIKNIYLLQPSDQKRSAGPFSPPMVGLANPLRQAVQSHLGYLNMFDRINMNAYIPDLGVVVLASQKGRAVVLSLTKLSAAAQYPARMGGQGRKTNYAMRVACILPFVGQEKVRTTS